MASALLKAPFRVGEKQVFLPDFSITLHRQSHLGPKYATFTVPLWFSKLDLRDYLFHAYNTRILSVRSYIKLSRVTRGQPSYLEEDFATPTRRYYRPQSIKRMTVELESPFVWPEPPQDREPWQEKYSDAMTKEQDKEDIRRSPTSDTAVDKDHAEAMRTQALKLFQGREQWKPHASNSLGPVLSHR